MRRLLTLLALLLLTAATAQGRLNPPNYYISQLPELKAGDVINGELTEESGQNFKDGSYLDMFVMYGEEGDEVTLLASSLEFDTHLSLFGPSGWILANVDDSLYGTDAELTITLPVSGRYLVVLSGYSDYDIGRYSLSRTDAGALSEAEAITLDVPGTFFGTYDAATAATVPHLSAPGVPFVIEVTEPTALDIRAASGDFDTFLLITDESGAIVVENDDENYSENTGWNTDSRAFAEYEPGVYYVYLTSLYSTPLGDYSINVRRFVAVD